MSWDDLPIELHVKILANRFELRNIACKKIQNCWNNYFGPIRGAIDIALELEVGEDGIFLVYWPSTAKIMEYCANKITGKNHRGFWKFIVEQIQTGLREKRDALGTDPYSIYYTRTAIACQEITNKLNKNY
tara:strand:- start:15300 stop:15692 length:393 start_codon:yes stop_codon:yes gene_type:complete